MVAQVEYCDYMGVGAKSAHGLSFTRYSGSGHFVEAICLDEGEGYVSVQQFVVGEIDYFLATLSQESLDLIATICEGGRLL